MCASRCRYAILTPKTWPRWRGDERQGVRHLLRSVNMDSDQYQMGRTKVFVKNPESVRAMSLALSDIKILNINRNFVGDYLGMENKPELRQFLAKRERIDFANSVTKYDRRFKPIKRDFILTPRYFYLIGREKVKKGPEKGQIREVLKKKVEVQEVNRVSLSTKQDDFFILHEAEADTFLESVFKTELLSLLCKRYEEATQRKLPLTFNDTLQFRVKKEGWGGGSTRTVTFISGQGNVAILKAGGKTLTISIGNGLPKNSKPTKKGIQHSKGYPRQETPSRSAPPAPRGACTLGACRTGAPQFPPNSRPQEQTYSTPRRAGRGPPAMALPKQYMSRHAKARTLSDHNMEFLNVPDQGMAGTQRKQSIGKKPPPAAGQPKPQPKVSGPRCRALYQYLSQDMPLDGGRVVFMGVKDFFLGIMYRSSEESPICSPTEEGKDPALARMYVQTCLPEEQACF
ncbi:hypothetical protein JD844_034276 [Phrynosoma platyrhinos]|uniref:Uncharacterized protein n=1 Tax=Phrynosoma platyrhinos TaxID=52577 RepID=A0ABQ7T8Z9_PHRPL|nr:hypothetical protein JD844_034276 [Phrynosoma platyrhinos]